MPTSIPVQDNLNVISASSNDTRSVEDSRAFLSFCSAVARMVPLSLDSQRNALLEVHTNEDQACTINQSSQRSPRSERFLILSSTKWNGRNQPCLGLEQSEQ